MEETVKFKGRVIEGVIRGKELVERFSHRLEGLVGFKPYPGTLNIKLERDFHIEDFEIARIQHILGDGSLWIDARLAPAILWFKGQSEPCWVIREERGLHHADVIEVISKDKLFPKLGLSYGDEIEIELFLVRNPVITRMKKIFRSIWPKHKRVIR